MRLPHLGPIVATVFAAATAAQEPAPTMSTTLGVVRLGRDWTGRAAIGELARVIVVPPAPSLVGNPYSVQGIAVGSGTCLGNLRFRDTVDFTLR